VIEKEIQGFPLLLWTSSILCRIVWFPSAYLCWLLCPHWQALHVYKGSNQSFSYWNYVLFKGQDSKLFLSIDLAIQSILCAQVGFMPITAIFTILINLFLWSLSEIATVVSFSHSCFFFSWIYKYLLSSYYPVWISWFKTETRLHNWKGKSANQ